MPKKAARPSVAERNAAPGGAAAVDRALSVLAAFRAGDGALALAEIAGRTGLYKSAVLRFLASLEHSRMIQRREDGRYVLGPEIARLNSVYVASFSLGDIVMPALRELVARTGESASFHVRQGEARLCLYRVDSEQPLRDHIKAGDLLPLDRGAGGRVLMAFSGAAGARNDRIRRDHVLVVAGDRVPDLAGISAPVFDSSDALAGAVTLTMPKQRLRPEQASEVMAAAKRITQALGGTFPRS